MSIFLNCKLIALFCCVMFGNLKSGEIPIDKRNGFWPHPEPVLTLIRRDGIPRTLREKIRIRKIRQHEQTIRAKEQAVLELRARMWCVLTEKDDNLDDADLQATVDSLNAQIYAILRK